MSLESTTQPPDEVTLIVGPQGKVTQMIFHDIAQTSLEDIAAFAEAIAEDDQNQVLVLDDFMAKVRDIVVVPNEGEATKALRTLVALKDGPRDDHYEQAKSQAWERAREVLYGPSTYRDLAVVTPSTKRCSRCGNPLGDAMDSDDHACPHNPEHSRD